MSAGRVRQTTLREAVTLTGIGVHSGEMVTLTVMPAEAGTGHVFVRGGFEELKADIGNIGPTELCTTLKSGNWSVATVEHLLAALSALEIDNAVIDIDGPEVPALDGSSQAFVAAFTEAGIVELSAPRRFIRVLRPFRVEKGNSYAELRPHDGRRFEIDVDYQSAVIGRQYLALDLTPDAFRDELASARTFGFLDEVEALWARGLARGASLENAVVIGPDGVVNPGGLRFADEFVRHKMLDAVGDLALAGAPILGAYRSYRGGHSLNARMIESFLAAPDAWELVEAPRPRTSRAADRVAPRLEPELT